MPSFHYYDYIGFIGALLLITAYILTQIRALSSSDWQYPLLNFCGAMLIAFSLCFDFNAPSMGIELFWAAISIFGMIKCRTENRHARAANSSGNAGFHDKS
jgi:hypothetical protein